jgi:hypothetical protein
MEVSGRRTSKLLCRCYLVHRDREELELIGTLELGEERTECHYESNNLYLGGSKC